MMNYALFLGCIIPYRLPQMEAATRKTLQIFDVDLHEMKGAGCCSDPAATPAVDYKTALAVAANNICIAEEMELDILNLCNGCFHSLKLSNETLKSKPRLKKQINEILAHVGKEFKGTINIRHLLEVMYKEIGLERIKDEIKTPFNDLKVSVHYGCHVLRPSNILNVDDPLRPESLDRLVKVTGAESVKYMRKMNCCNYCIRVVNKDISLKLSAEKLKQVKQAQADCIVLICPGCFMQYDLTQKEIIRLLEEEIFSIPVFSYSQLLGLAMDMSAEELGLQFHRVKFKKLFEKPALFA
ncbi:MAG: CoB--CoM heterodisulfide reductase iron-sulfur subunit B family protein [Promethearchaeota archaeon]